MEFRFSEEDEAFRGEVVQFLETELPPGWADMSEGPAEEGAANDERWAFTRAFQRSLAARGWLTLGWPTEHGGAGAGPVRQAMFNEAMAHYRAPSYNQGVDRVGPTIIMYGSDAHKEFFLPAIRNAEITWCQGFSEPGSGSDLASLQTRAVKDGDDWVVNGQKIWTSGAHRADWMILLARTDPDAPKHKGITYFMLDMHSPGVEVRPLVNMTNTHEFNEVFFEDVRIPSRHILGEVNRGWYGAVTTLDFERSSIGSAVGMRQGVEAIIDVAREYRGSGQSSLGENEATRNALADRYIEAQTAMMISYRIVSMQSQGMIPNHEASMAKLYAMELNQRIQSTAMKVLGLYGQLGGGDPYAPKRGRYQYGFMRSVANTIEGGTSEIQRNIIATRGLGLPRG